MRMRSIYAVLFAAFISLGVRGQSVPPSITFVSNSFSGSSAIAPNTWVSIYGTGLAPAHDTRTWTRADFTDGQMPVILDGVSVTMNGEQAYIYFVSPTQLNVLTPPDLATGRVDVQVTANGQSSPTVAVQAQPYSAAFLTFNGGPYVTATHADGSIAGPTTLYPGISTPVQPGETVVLYASGFGVTSPIVKGSAVQSGTLPSVPSVKIGSNDAKVLFAGLVSPGLFQFNVVVPANTPDGDNLIIAEYAGQSTQPGLLLNVEAVVMQLSDDIVAAGKTATLQWSSLNATSCNASGDWSGARAAKGSAVVTTTVPGYYTYTLTCDGPLGSNSQSVTLTAYGPAQHIDYDPAEASYHQGFQASFFVAPPNQITRLQTTMVVPPHPPIPTDPRAALFLWPGLDPATNSVNFLPINNGVLQPVLTWGPSCAPTQQPVPFSSWWISAQYVNTIGSTPGFSGCQSGPSMLVNPGDVLLIDMALDLGTGVWSQTAKDANTDQAVTFSINMQGQGQNWAFFGIEQWYGATIQTPVAFSDTTITFQSPDTDNWCSSYQAATPNDYVMTPPIPQKNGTQCFIRSMIVTE